MKETLIDDSPHLDTLHSISRDLVHAARSLAKDRGFTLVCVISLGIGMGALVALATFTRAVTAPARGIDTNGLTELLVLPLGPLRAKAGEWALEQWSYPDYQALRDTDTGMAITGWTRDSSQVRRADSGRRGASSCGDAVRVGQLLPARLACRSRADRDSIPRSTTRHRPSRASS